MFHGLNVTFFVISPALVLVVEALLTGWHNSSLRLLLSRNRSTLADWFYWALTFLRISEYFNVVATIGIYGYFARHDYSLHLLSRVHPLFQFIAGFFIIDFMGYWTHRLLHRAPLLWEFHKIHHSATELNILLTFRFHPLENVVWHLQAMLLFLCFGASTVTFAVFDITYMVLGQMQHARLKWDFGALGKVIISPTFHRLHHSTDPADFNRNLGPRLTIWDRIFGTYSAKDISFDAIGLGEHPHLFEQFWRPFRSLLRSPRGTISGPALVEEEPSRTAER